MGTTRTLSLIIIIGSVAGCYGKARPSLRPANVPQLVDGAKLDVDVDKVRYWSRSEWRYKTGFVVDSMEYNGERLTYNQARTLADPKWGAKLAEHESLVRSCKRANVPRYIGYTAMLAGSVMFYYGGFLFPEQPTLQYTVAGGTLGLGALAYATGYLVFGGRKCGDANEMYDKLQLAKADETRIYREDLILEIADIATAFNKRMARAADQKERTQAQAPTSE